MLNRYEQVSEFRNTLQKMENYGIINYGCLQNLKFAKHLNAEILVTECIIHDAIHYFIRLLTEHLTYPTSSLGSICWSLEVAHLNASPSIHA